MAQKPRLNNSRKPALVPERAVLCSLDADAASALVVAVADVAIVVDQHGIIKSVAQDGGSIAAESWVGKPWAET